MGQKRAFTIVELAIVGVIFFLMALALTPFVKIAKDRSTRINCTNNLMRISLGLHKYALEHGDSFPQSLKALYPDYIKDGAIFDCPASKTVGTPDVPDYIYTPGLSETSPGKEIIVQDIDGNHKKRGKNVVRVDGSVEWIGSAY